MKAGTTKRQATRLITGWAYNIGPYTPRVEFNVAHVDTLTFSSVNGNRKKPNPFSLRRTQVFPLNGVRDEKWFFKATGNPHSYATYSGQQPDGISSWDTSGALVKESVAQRNVFRSEKDAAYTIALNRLRAVIQSSDLNLAMTIAESGELKTLTGSLKSSIGKAISVFRRIGGLPSAAANAWLVWSFALRPVISDAYAMVRHSRALFETRSIKASGARQISQTFAWGSGKAVCTGQVKHKFGITFQITNRDAFEASRLGFTNPVGIAWELVPLSFVVDYFFNIGGYLASIESSYAAGLSFLGGYSTSTSRLATVTTPATAATYSGDAYVRKTYTQSLTGMYVESCCDRQVLTSFPGPRLPAINLDLGSSQLLSLAALLQVFTFKR